MQQAELLKLIDSTARGANGVKDAKALFAALPQNLALLRMSDMPPGMKPRSDLKVLNKWKKIAAADPAAAAKIMNRLAPVIQRDTDTGYFFHRSRLEPFLEQEQPAPAAPAARRKSPPRAAAPVPAGFRAARRKSPPRAAAPVPAGFRAARRKSPPRKAAAPATASSKGSATPPTRIRSNVVNPLPASREKLQKKKTKKGDSGGKSLIDVLGRGIGTAKVSDIPGGGGDTPAFDIWLMWEKMAETSPVEAAVVLDYMLVGLKNKGAPYIFYSENLIQYIKGTDALVAKAVEKHPKGAGYMIERYPGLAQVLQFKKQSISPEMAKAVAKAGYTFRYDNDLPDKAMVAFIATADPAKRRTRYFLLNGIKNLLTKYPRTSDTFKVLTAAFSGLLSYRRLFGDDYAQMEFAVDIARAEAAKESGGDEDVMAAAMNIVKSAIGVYSDEEGDDSSDYEEHFD